MTHWGIRAAVVERVKALGAAVGRNLVPDISGSLYSSSKFPDEEAIISISARGKNLSDLLEKNPRFQYKKRRKGILLLITSH